MVKRYVPANNNPDTNLVSRYVPANNNPNTNLVLCYVYANTEVVHTIMKPKDPISWGSSAVLILSDFLVLCLSYLTF